MKRKLGDREREGWVTKQVNGIWKDTRGSVVEGQRVMVIE